VQVRVLGPLEIHDHRGALALGTPKQRAVLALLLARDGAVTVVDDIVAELWEGRPPASAPDNARMYAANLRRIFDAAPGGPTVQRRSGGYLLTVDPAELDLYRFRELVRQGRTAQERQDPTTAAARFTAGLDLWRGPVLADVRTGPALARWCRAVEEERLRALEELGEALLDVGDTEAAARTARDMVVEQPLRERAYAVLMRALQRAGDTSGALAAFESARRELAGHLGVEPGEELRRLRQLVLDTGAEPPAPRAVAGTGVTPRQLPTDVVSFAGREGYLRRLDALLPAADDVRPETVVISAVSGTAGVGKTALAVHWAHRVKDRFPDGQLYVNLRGFDPGGSPMDPAEAVRGFLDALQVPAARIPTGTPEQAALYRSLLTGRRILIVLDNARDAEQVRPLLPRSPGCLAVVTSRSRLHRLMAADAAHALTLDLLTADEARQLLARRLGAGRMAAEPDAVEDIVAGCALLPLALAVVAAHAATRPHFPLATLADELRENRTRLDVLDAGDTATDVRAVFSWSYRALSPAAARLFRLLGLLSATDIGLAAAASLAGLPVDRTRPLLAELTAAHLLTEPAAARYTFHDLLRAYAHELVCTDDPPADRDAAVRRLLDHYLHTGHRAALLLHSFRAPIPLAPLEPGTTPEDLSDHDDALAWFTVERPVVLAAIRQAAEAGFDVHTWQLAWTLTSFLQRQGHWDDQVTAQCTAMAAARRLGDRSAQTHAHRSLARIYARQGRFDEAHEHLEQALELLVELGDVLGQAHAHHNRSLVFGQQGDYRQALVAARQGQAFYEQVGNPSGKALALNEVGWFLTLLGEPGKALACCEQALALHRGLGNQAQQADCLSNLGYINHVLGNFAEAVRCDESALALYRATGGDRYYEGRVLTHLGETYHAQGKLDAARTTWEQALDILDGLGDPDAEQVLTRLKGLTGQGPADSPLRAV
jgi:DNA-binding SARP family transcriptional activator/tetratricopeptide (TPR) repeat protein